MVNIAVDDLGASAAKKFDCEAWLPGQGRYRELTSTSNTTDFQARRLDIRMRPADGGRPVTLHTLNGTAVASAHIIALLENGQHEDGVAVPGVLRAMGRAGAGRHHVMSHSDDTPEVQWEEDVPASGRRPAAASPRSTTSRWAPPRTSTSKTGPPRPAGERAAVLRLSRAGGCHVAGPSSSGGHVSRFCLRHRRRRRPGRAGRRQPPARAGVSVTVLEAQRLARRPRRLRPVVDGFTLNRGPHALYLGGAARGELAALGIRPAGGCRCRADPRLVDGDGWSARC